MFETIDELHTLSTSLGNTILSLHEKKEKALGKMKSSWSLILIVASLMLENV